MEIGGITGYAGSALNIIMPTPKSSLSFGGVLSAVKDAALEAAPGLAQIDDKYSPLLEKQLEMQEQMMLVSLVSNVEKTQHETRMAAVRNVRVA